MKTLNDVIDEKGAIEVAFDLGYTEEFIQRIRAGRYTPSGYALASAIGYYELDAGATLADYYADVLERASVFRIIRKPLPQRPSVKRAIAREEEKRRVQAMAQELAEYRQKARVD